MLHNFIFIFIKELFIKKGQLFTKLKKIMYVIQFSTTQRLAKLLKMYIILKTMTKNRRANGSSIFQCLFITY